MKRFLFAGVICSVCIAGGARSSAADVVYALRVLSPGEKLSSRPQTRVLASNEAHLEEVWNGSYMGTHATYTRELRLTQFALKRVVVMDANLKIYRVEPLREEKTEPEPTLRSVQITDLGEEPILGFSTRHYRINTSFTVKDVTAQNEVKNTDLTVRQDWWAAPPATVRGYPTNSPTPIAAPAGVDVELWKRIQSGLRVRQIVSQPSKTEPQSYVEVYREELTSLAQCELDKAAFEIPSDYKEVSSSEFARLRRKRKFDIMARQTGVERAAFPDADPPQP